MDLDTGPFFFVIHLTEINYTVFDMFRMCKKNQQANSKLEYKCILFKTLIRNKHNQVSDYLSVKMGCLWFNKLGGTKSPLH